MKLGNQVLPNAFITISTPEINLCEYGKYRSIIGFAINNMEKNFPSWQLLVRFKIFVVAIMIEFSEHLHLPPRTRVL
jgi:hypothetical protein